MIQIFLYLLTCKVPRGLHQITASQINQLLFCSVSKLSAEAGKRFIPIVMSETKAEVAFHSVYKAKKS